MLSTWEAATQLDRYEVPRVEERVDESTAEAQSVAREIGYPVVLKAHAPGLAHKSGGWPRSAQQGGLTALRCGRHLPHPAVPARRDHRQVIRPGRFRSASVREPRSRRARERAIGTRRSRSPLPRGAGPGQRNVHARGQRKVRMCRNTLSVGSNGAPPASVGVTLWRLRRRESWGDRA